MGAPCITFSASIGQGNIIKDEQERLQESEYQEVCCESPSFKLVQKTRTIDMFNRINGHVNLEGGKFHRVSSLDKESYAIVGGRRR